VREGEDSPLPGELSGAYDLVSREGADVIISPVFFRLTHNSLELPPAGIEFRKRGYIPRRHCQHFVVIFLDFRPPAVDDGISRQVRVQVRTALLSFSLAVTTGCSIVRTDVRPPVIRARHTESAPTLQEQEFAKKNCGDYGLPKLDPTQNFGPTTVIYREGYVLDHSATDKIAIWVCEGFDRNQWDPPNTNRKDVFKPDPLLPKNERSELADYKGSKLDRGHQAPAGDFNDQTLKDQSFFLSNMAPQSPPLNQQFWRLLEDKVRSWATADSGIYVFTGGFFYDPKEDNPATATGQVHYRRIGRDEVAVPTHFYKVVFGKDRKGKWRAVGFVVENRPYDTKKTKFEDTIQSIDWIEAHTGITFMPEMDDAVAAKLKQNPGQMW
jgi:endonuclease G, mitochondrial